MSDKQIERLGVLIGDMAIKENKPINWNGGVEI